MTPISWITAAIVLHVLVHPVNTDHVADKCYCMKTELAGLRNSVQIEAVNVNGENVYLIAEQVGIILKYNPGNENMRLTTYINVSHLVEVNPGGNFDENGLLGFAVHPNFATNQMIYLYSVRRINDEVYVVISEIQGTAANGEKMLVLIKQDGVARKGGQMLFGLDEYLYVFVGDGLNRTQSVESKAQDGAELLGKVLRLDVDKLTVADFKLQYYDIPDNNPKKAGWRPEVYAMGFRNPWGCTIDRADSRGRIFCGDNGSSIDGMDEINLIKSGGNYGYPLKEGTHCIGNQTLCNNIADEVLPIYAFNTSSSYVQTLILGPVYRGTDFTSLQQQLIFGDFYNGNLFSLEETVKSDNTSQWMVHNITECAASQCGCDYKSQRLQYLLTFGTSWSNEMMMLMSNSLQPGNTGAVLLSLAKGVSSTPTCGSAEITFSTLLGLVLVSISVLNYLERD